MQKRMLGGLWPVSSLTIGGGGLGHVWGPTSRQEAVATLREAVEAGITLIDVAPGYGDGEAEEVVGEAFGGKPPVGVRVSTKHHVGHGEPGEIEAAMVKALNESLNRMQLQFVDVYILHSQIVPSADPERETWTTPLALYEGTARQALESLVQRGRIGAWGITAVQFPRVLEAVFTGDPAPPVAQLVANVLDAPGDMRWSEQAASPRDLIARAQKAGTGVMGIRAVQAGALTDSLDRVVDSDHPAAIDFARAAPFRALAAEFGESAAALAHRYALSMDGVDTVVLGVKNRTELRECIRAAERKPLSAEEISLIDEAMGRPPSKPIDILRADKT